MTQRTKTPARYPVTIFERTDKTGKRLTDIAGVQDPATGREWRWREQDQSGLADFLRETIFKGWHPIALHGTKMRMGRKVGTPGVIRKAIAKLLNKNPTMKNADIWAALTNKPPKGYAFHDNRQGKYIEDAHGQTVMAFARFRNVASEERHKLKG